MTVICNYCKIAFEKREKEIRKTRHNFCSHTCAAKFLNPLRRIKSVCPRCNGKKDYKAKLCHKCKVSANFKVMLETPISEYIYKGNARTKYSEIRKMAGIAIVRYDRKYICALCDFDICLDVCHIKPLAEFPVTALMREVNGEHNLVYLCPNHHRLFDRGRISLAGVEPASPD